MSSTVKLTIYKVTACVSAQTVFGACMELYRLLEPKRVMNSWCFVINEVRSAWDDTKLWEFMTLLGSGCPRCSRNTSRAGLSWPAAAFPLLVHVHVLFTFDEKA